MNIEVLFAIQAELQLYKKSRKEALIEALKQRLDKSLMLYQEQMRQKETFLLKQDELKLLKNLRK